MAYEKSEAVELVIAAGHRLVEAGLIARTWGNISARISDTQFVITPSGMAYDRLTAKDIVTVNIADCSYEGDIKPSSEKGIHAECYRLRPDVNFVVHTHQLYATACGTVGEALEAPGVLPGGTAPCAEYAISSTKMLKKKVSACIEKNPEARAFFMRCHGALFLGTDFDDAFELSAKLEELCRGEVEKKLSLGSENEYHVLPDGLLGGIEEDSAIFVSSPAVAQTCKKRGRLRPMIDDMAQIGGVSFACVREKGNIVRALKGRNAVLIRNGGAVCTGVNEDEAGAVASVLEKNCLAQLYSEACGKKQQLGRLDALLQRTIYVMKYSKLK